MIGQVVSVTVKKEDDREVLSVTIEKEDDRAGYISDSIDRG